MADLLKDKFDQAKFDEIKNEDDGLVTRQQLLELAKSWRQNMMITALGAAKMEHLATDDTIKTIMASCACARIQPMKFPAMLPQQRPPHCICVTPCEPLFPHLAVV